MNLNGSSPCKPKSVFCQRYALKEWTGWSDKRINYLVAEKKLKCKTYSKKGWREFYVESAQQLIDEGW